MTTRRGEGGFDRIKPPERRLLERRAGGRLEAGEAEEDGRAALFSAGSRSARRGAVGLSVHCSRCGEASPLDLPTAVRSAFPLFLVAPWKRHAVFAVCPACRRRSWLRLSGPGRAS